MAQRCSLHTAQRPAHRALPYTSANKLWGRGRAPLSVGKSCHSWGGRGKRSPPLPVGSRRHPPRGHCPTPACTLTARNALCCLHGQQNGQPSGTVWKGQIQGQEGQQRQRLGKGRGESADRCMVPSGTTKVLGSGGNGRTTSCIYEMTPQLYTLRG